MEDDPKVVLIGEDIGKLGGVFRITDGLQKDFGEAPGGRHPARRGRHPGHRGRAWPCAATGRSWRSSSTGSSSPPSTRSSPRWPRSTPAPGAGCRCRSPSASLRRRHRRGRAPQREPEAYFARTPPASRSSRSATRSTPTGRPAGHRPPRPGRVPRAQAPVLGQGRGRPGRRPRAAVQLAGRAGGDDTDPAGLRPMVKTALQAAEAAAEEGRSLEVIDLRTLSAAGPAPGRGVRPPDRPLRRRPRGADTPGPGRRDRRAGHRDLLPLPGGPGAAGRWLRHPLPAVQAPGRSTCPTWTGCSAGHCC